MIIQSPRKSWETPSTTSPMRMAMAVKLGRERIGGQGQVDARRPDHEHANGSMTMTGPDLLLDLTPSGADVRRPLRERLEDALRNAIRQGRLRPGDRLPATRTLAAELGCSRWVVVEAYDQLAAEGWIEGRAGSGTRVRARAAEPAEAGEPVREP